MPIPHYCFHIVEQEDMNTWSFRSLSASHGNGKAAKGIDNTAGCTSDCWRGSQLTASIGLFFSFSLRHPFCSRFSVLLVIPLFIWPQDNGRSDVVVPKLLAHVWSKTVPYYGSEMLPDTTEYAFCTFKPEVWDQSVINSWDLNPVSNTQ